MSQFEHKMASSRTSVHSREQLVFLGNPDLQRTTSAVFARAGRLYGNTADCSMKVAIKVALKVAQKDMGLVGRHVLTMTSKRTGIGFFDKMKAGLANLLGRNFRLHFVAAGTEDEVDDVLLDIGQSLRRMQKDGLLRRSLKLLLDGQGRLVVPSGRRPVVLKDVGDFLIISHRCELRVRERQSAHHPQVQGRGASTAHGQPGFRDESDAAPMDARINPATGLPMMGAVDAAGNVYGASNNAPGAHNYSFESTDFSSGPSDF